MQIDVNKTLYPLYTTKKVSHFTATITKMRFVGNNTQVYYENLHNRLPAGFQSRVLLFKETLPWSSMKPQIMTVVYSARLLSVT